MLAKGNRVVETSATTGQGTLDLAGAYSDAFATFVEAGITNGQQVRYMLTEGNDFEIGIGTFSTGSPNTLSRTTVLLSKIGGTAGTTKMTISVGVVVRLILAAEDLDAAEIAFDPTGLSNTDATDLQEAIADHDAAIDETVVGPASVTDEQFSVFDGTSGKLIKEVSPSTARTLLGLGAAALLGGFTINVVELSGSTYTPTSGTTSIIYFLQGAGGGGGGAEASDATSAACGGGGQAGGCAIGSMTAAELGASAAISLGTAGTAGAATGGNGGAGGNTTFNPAGTGPTVTAAGGSGGIGSSSSTYVSGGAGGSAAGGTTNADFGITGESGSASASYTAQHPPFGGKGGQSFLGRAGIGSTPTGANAVAGEAGAKGGGGGGASAYQASAGAAGGAGGAGCGFVIEIIGA